MKPQPKAAAKAKKPAAKATPAKAAAKKAAPAKAAPKKAVPKKPAAKPVVKKAAAKPAAKKPVAKKPAAKAAKPVTKKPVPKKPAAKPVAKAVAKKAVAKKAAPLKVAPKKAAAKPAVKTPPKSAAPAKKAPAKPASTTAAKSAASSKATAASAKQAAPVVAANKAVSVAVSATKPAGVPTPPAAPQPGIPPRATKVSARLAQITVPSMPQAVASTAAKASYYQTPSRPVTSPAFVAVKKDPKLANNWKTKTVDQLSDAEVLAMPDSEYMNDKQMAYFRQKLQQLKQDILNNAGETTEHLREDTVIVPDPADRATIEEEHALELRTRDRERKLLKKIEQSISRIDAGDYGYCDETGEPIGVGRLLARPTATLSLEAQQRRELKQKMFGD